MKTLNFVHDEIVEKIVISSAVVAWIPTQEILESLNPILRGWGFIEGDTVDEELNELPKENYDKIISPTITIMGLKHHYEVWKTATGINVTLIKDRHIEITIS